jgi:hypothetical protein
MGRRFLVVLSSMVPQWEFFYAFCFGLAVDCRPVQIMVRLKNKLINFKYLC